uniref:Thyroglobulin type-1 domain-containing protein n=1 Tax=Cyclopterus lumpus TaxID=8103 RepID=A0A8C3AXN4_CYCLU
MSNPEIQNQPLLADGNQQAANAQGGRSSRAYKVAGLTLLASVLIVGQALTVYFVLSQKSDIKSLQEQNNNLDSQLTRSRAVAVPVRMSMNKAANMMDVFVDEETSTKDPEQTVTQQATVCQLEAAGMKPVELPGFRPACDERGLYRVQQCFVGHCWCVNPADGQQLGAPRKGRHCGASLRTGSPSKLLTLPDAA